MVATCPSLTLFYMTGRVDYPPETDTQLLFSSEVSRVCINISVFDDTEVEDTEVFQVSLSADFEDDTVLIQPDTTLVIILDDDNEGEYIIAGVVGRTHLCVESVM